MKLKVNGKEESLEKDKLSVSEVLKLFEVSQPEMVSVQLNGEFINRDNFDSTNIKENDELDFLYFMGGG